METISFSAASEDLGAMMDKVCSDQAPLLITRNGESEAVLLSRAEYEPLEETACLLQSPANAKRLLDAIAALEGGSGIVRHVDLIQ